MRREIRARHEKRRVFTLLRVFAITAFRKRRTVMRTKILYSMFFSACVAVIFFVALVPLQAETVHCSTAAAAGKWAYTYTGSIVAANGSLPAAAVGHYAAHADGTLAGSQTRSVGGSSGEEDVAGTFTVNEDCSGT